jgi:hypothetical protein
MTIETSWPWITLSIAAVVVLNPLGLEIVANAFSAGNPTARNLAQVLATHAAEILGALGLVEFGIRKLLLRRQRRKYNQAASGAKQNG